MTSCAYIAVHGGAGIHSAKRDKEVKTALKSACTAALSYGLDNSRLTSGDDHTAHTEEITSLRMVEEAICVLENDECLNAGHGSSLTLDGTVECDASIIAHINRPGDSRFQPHSLSSANSGLFGSIGAVSGVKNPIKLARCILDHSRVPDKLGRVPPLTLASTGAHKFATAHGIETVPPDALITPRATAQWKTWTRRLALSESDANDTIPTPAHLRGVGPKVENPEDDEDEEGAESLMQDTVGAAAFCGGTMAAGVSRYILFVSHSWGHTER
ncbi:hypothetical protein D9619_002038 [Psilocybe cf. subviscida]|uniref:Uncharacterized protein n=1 Tax=Psilocybe cf. subviscida TaxID=2480587 RepID=A0A8H5BGC1_9AGAR|nr:hypothetical protein D9619_002038 [Psilocybe cf. subviscida]